MTAEVAVLNTQAVALAADSASTISGPPTGPKVYNAANKLFALSPRQPVGIMVYDSADLCGVPWETVVKEFRRRHGEEARDSLDDYLTSFLGFCDENAILLPAEQYDAWAEEFLLSVLAALRAEAERDALDSAQAPDQVLAEKLAAVCDELEQCAFMPGYDALTAAAAVSAEPGLLEEARRWAAFDPPLDAKLAERLAAAWLYRIHDRTPRSGVVVAGFGEHDRFPALVAAQVYGLRQRRLVHVSESPMRVTARNGAIVRAFAQTEMTRTFMEGVHPDYARFIHRLLHEILTEQYPAMLASAATTDAQVASELKLVVAKLGASAAALLVERAQAFTAAQSVDPITQAVEFLPKEELAALAESLVNLTSLRKRVSLDAETVGGPVDVAVISKGDGFVWMRRKHYFRPELNPQFFARYLGGTR